MKAFFMITLSVQNVVADGVAFVESGPGFTGSEITREK
jgi:hypothetical protein